MMCLRSQSDDGCIGQLSIGTSKGTRATCDVGISQSRQGQISGIMKLSAFSHRLIII